jgi:nucleoside-diphosphate-sugar epimerase
MREERVMTELHVVLGAGGGVGGALVEELVAQGRQVRAVSRSGGPRAGAETRAADVGTPDGAATAVEGASVVYHAAQSPYTDWSPFPAMTRTIAEAAGAAGAKLVLADNLYMYGPVDGPLREDSPMRPTSTKGQIRLEMAEQLLSMHRAGTVRVTLGRASDYYGPGGTNSSLGEQLFGPAVRGKKVRWLGDPDVPHTEHYLGDIARGLIVLGTRDEADGEVWHLPAAPATTGRAFVELISRAAGHPVAFTPTSRGMVRLAGVFVPVVRAIHEVMYQWEAPFTIDASRFQATFGPFATTPHEEAVAATVAWFREQEAHAAA